MGNNGDHRKQEVIEYYSRRGKILKQINKALQYAVDVMVKFYWHRFTKQSRDLSVLSKAIPKEIKRKGKFRQN